MANRRNLSWSTALRELRDQRARRAGVREERLRATAGLRNPMNLSSWRGRSGRRYVVGVHALSEPDILDITEAIMIAVRRDGEGVARVVDIMAAGESPRERSRRRWMTRMRASGATELHVHRLAEDEAERWAIVEDLRSEA